MIQVKLARMEGRRAVIWYCLVATLSIFGQLCQLGMLITMDAVRKGKDKGLLIISW